MRRWTCCVSCWQTSLKVDHHQCLSGNFENVSSTLLSLIAVKSKHFLTERKFCKRTKCAKEIYSNYLPYFVTRCDGVLESETRIPNIPRKLSSISFKNAVIDYWKYRIENAEKVTQENDCVKFSFNRMWKSGKKEQIP